jgi:hypothetical protein
VPVRVDARGAVSAAGPPAGGDLPLLAAAGDEAHHAAANDETPVCYWEPNSHPTRTTRVLTVFLAFWN